MFSQDNRRFLTISASLCGVFSVTLLALVAIYRTGNANATPVLATVIGFAGVTINQLISMLRDEQASQEADTSREVMHQKLDQAQAEVHEIARKTDPTEIAKKVVEISPLPATPEEFKVMLADIIRRVGLQVSKDQTDRAFQDHLDDKQKERTHDERASDRPGGPPAG